MVNGGPNIMRLLLLGAVFLFVRVCQCMSVFSVRIKSNIPQYHFQKIIKQI